MTPLEFVRTTSVLATFVLCRIIILIFKKLVKALQCFTSKSWTWILNDATQVCSYDVCPGNICSNNIYSNIILFNICKFVLTTFILANFLLWLLFIHQCLMILMPQHIFLQIWWKQICSNAIYPNDICSNTTITWDNLLLI